MFLTDETDRCFVLAKGSVSSNPRDFHCFSMSFIFEATAKTKIIRGQVRWTWKSFCRKSASNNSILRKISSEQFSYCTSNVMGRTILLGCYCSEAPMPLEFWNDPTLQQYPITFCSYRTGLWSLRSNFFIEKRPNFKCHTEADPPSNMQRMHVQLLVMVRILNRPDQKVFYIYCSAYVKVSLNGS